MNLKKYIFLAVCFLSISNTPFLLAARGTLILYPDIYTNPKDILYQDLERLSKADPKLEMESTAIDIYNPTDPVLGTKIENTFIDRLKQSPDIVFSGYDIINAIDQLKPKYLDYMLSQNKRLYTKYIIQKAPLPDYYTTALESPFDYGKTMKDFLVDNTTIVNDLMDRPIDEFSQNMLEITLGTPLYLPWREKSIAMIHVLTKHGFDWSTYLSLPQGIDMRQALQNDPTLRNAMTPKHPGAVKLPPISSQVPEIHQPTWWDRTKQTLSKIADKLTDV
ncbi:hypothetical protein KBD08_00610 [Candidatus Babeliales bacterium]|nr:hypothetical protein [Candidatus Babeliales bacterium]